MTRTLAALLSAVAAFAAPVPVAAQQTTPTAAGIAVDAADAFSAGRMWSLARLGDAAISPDGSIAVVTVTRFDIAENRGATDIWLVPVAGGPARQLTSDKASDTSPAFSPDGRSIAFLSKRGDDQEPQVYLIPVDGGEARRLTQVPTGANGPGEAAQGTRREQDERAQLGPGADRLLGPLP
jgi:hypothetical protein